MKARRLVEGNCELLDLLDSLVIAYAGGTPDLSSQALPSKPVVDWLAVWWPKVCLCCPAGSSVGPASVVCAVETQLDEAEELAVEEHHYHMEQRALQDMQTREQEAREAEEHAWEEDMQKAYDEALRPSASDSHGGDTSTWESEMERIEEMYRTSRRRRRDAPADWRSWDNWAMFDELHKPPERTRRWVEIELGPTGEREGAVKRLRMPLAVGNGTLEIRDARIVTSNASSASTVVADPPSGSPDLPRPPSTSVPHSLEYSEYAAQYARYKAGEISGQYIVALWGERVWDLMMAQEEVERLEGNPERADLGGEPGHASQSTTHGVGGHGGLQSEDGALEVTLVAETRGPECTGGLGLGDAQSRASLNGLVRLSAVSAIFSLCF